MTFSDAIGRLEDSLVEIISKNSAAQENTIIGHGESLPSQTFTIHSLR